MSAKSFTTSSFHPPNVSGREAVPHIFRQRPHVFAVIVRNKNGNVVVLEAAPKDGRLSDVDSYWLDLDPSYKKRARAWGRTHDRDEFGMMDRRGYGLRVLSSHAKYLIVSMAQLPNVHLRVRLEGDVTNAYVQLNGAICRLQHVYVHDTVGYGFLPQVEYVEVHGLNRCRQQVVERFRP